MNETLFHSVKELSLVHGRIIELNLLESLHFPIKTLFGFQYWGNIFASTPKHFSEPLVHLFYANLRFIKYCEFEIFFMGKRIFLDYDMFDAIFDINCFGFTTSLRNPWPFDFDVLFENAKRVIALDNCISLPSAPGTTHLSFEVHVITHIVATTLLYWTISLSSLSFSVILYSRFALLLNIRLIFHPSLLIT